MKKIKILVDGRCVGGEGQGMLTYLSGLYNAVYDQYGEQYELFFAGYDFEAMQSCFPFLDDEHFVQLQQANRFVLFWKTFPEIIEKLSIDFAHFQYLTPFRKKCKHIVTTHDILFLDFPEEFSYTYKLKRKFLFKRSLKNSDIRLTVSNYSKNRIAELFGIPGKTIKITPNAVHPKFLEPYDKKAAQERIKHKLGAHNYLLYVSRIEKRKNHELILKAYKDSNLAKRGIQLVLVGNDTLGETDVVKSIKELQTKYPGMVHWFPYLDEADLLDSYRAARMFVYPSLAEGFGIPPIEAAATGLETLCSNKTAMEDFAFFGDQQFDPEKYDEFKAKLEKLVLKTAEQNHNPANHAFIKVHYSWNQAAKVLHKAICAQGSVRSASYFSINTLLRKRA